MKMVKSLLLGSAAGLFAVAGAQAADLPVKAKAVEYVKICSLYGAGYYYVPGTDTCVKIGGYVRADYAVNASGSHVQFWNGAGGTSTRNSDDYRTRARARLTVDTRTQTEYGTLRSYINFGAQYTSTGDTYGSGGLSADAWFIQFAGFTFGRAYSFFEMPWETYGANYTASLLGGTDGSTFISNLIGYTAQLGNGVSASIALEDAGNRPGFVFNNANALALPGSASTNNVAGGTFPDIVGNIQVDQAWGTAKIAGLAHLVRGNYYGTTATPSEGNGHPGDKWGWAVQGGLKVNLPWGPGDNITVSGAYTEGDLQLLFGGVGGTSAIGIWKGSEVFYANAFDAVYGTGTGLELTKGWGVNATLTHYWTPTLRTGVFGAYTAIDYNGNATALICASPGTNMMLGGGAVCNPDWNVWQIGTRTVWSPVANLDIGLEVLYSKFHQNYGGTTTTAAAQGSKPAGTYTNSDMDVWSGMLRVQRNFWP